MSQFPPPRSAAWLRQQLSHPDLGSIRQAAKLPGGPNRETWLKAYKGGTLKSETWKKIEAALEAWRKARGYHRSPVVVRRQEGRVLWRFWNGVEKWVPIGDRPGRAPGSESDLAAAPAKPSTPMDVEEPARTQVEDAPAQNLQKRPAETTATPTPSLEPAEGPSKPQAPPDAAMQGPEPEPAVVIEVAGTINKIVEGPAAEALLNRRARELLLERAAKFSYDLGEQVRLAIARGTAPVYREGRFSLEGGNPSIIWRGGQGIYRAHHREIVERILVEFSRELAPREVTPPKP